MTSPLSSNHPEVIEDDTDTYIAKPLEIDEPTERPVTRSSERKRKLIRNANRVPESGLGNVALGNRKRKAEDKDEPFALHVC